MIMAVSEAIRDVGSLIASLTALVLAIWGGRMRRIAEKPKLKVGENIISHNQPISNGTGSQVHVDSTHYRFLIKNEGNATAKDVEVYIEEIANDGVKRDNFLPVPLRWTHYQTKGGGQVVRNILPKQSVYLDFCVLISGDYRLRLATPIEVEDFTVLNPIKNSVLNKQACAIHANNVASGMASHEVIQAWIDNESVVQKEEIEIKGAIYQESGDTVSVRVKIKINGTSTPVITIVY